MKKLLLISLLLLSPISGFSVDLDPAFEKEANMVYAEVMSPFCPGRLLRDCPSSQATELKHEIYRRIADGERSESILEYLVTVYGSDILAAPEAKGFGIVAWIAPGAFLVVGGIFIVLWLRYKSKDSSVASEETIDPNIQKKIDLEIKRA